MDNFDCGCPVKFDVNDLPLECSATWDLISSGDVKGCFQIDSPLGVSWCKKVRPRSIEELSALIAIIRPGCLDAIVDGKNMTQHYSDRKEGKEEITYPHPSLEEILRSTYGIIVFQEQTLKIAQKIAGFTLTESEKLRKGIGKKKVEIIAELEQKFKGGCKKIGLVSETEADDLFDVIRKSQRYQFNASHSLGYALEAYRNAWLRQHFPLLFFTSWLDYSGEEPKPKEEVDELIASARQSSIDVTPPTLLSVDDGGFHLKDGKVWYGLRQIKDIGQSHIKSLLRAIEKGELDLRCEIGKFKWIDILYYILSEVNSKVASNLIKVGCLSFLNMPRKRMLFEYNIWKKLKDDEMDVAYRHPDLKSGLTAVVESVKNARRRQTVNDLLAMASDPPYSLEDNVMDIIEDEEALLGISLTLSRLDGKDLTPTVSCRDFLNGRGDKSNILGVEIKQVKEYLVNKGPSKGQKMAFLTVEDDTCRMDCMAFAESYEKYQELLVPKNVVYIIGDRTKKGTLSVNKVIPA